MSLTDIAASYSTMSDDEILHLACGRADLKPEALLVLDSELQRRKLSHADIEEYRTHLANEKPKAPEPIGKSFNGIGTKVYGKRDFLPDGSFVTTKWIIFYFAPILPIKSMRVSKVSTGYLVHETSRPNIRQALYVYSFVLTLALACFLALVAEVQVHPRIPAGLSYAMVVCVCLVPWLLRRIARQHSK